MLLVVLDYPMSVSVVSFCKTSTLISDDDCAIIPVFFVSSVKWGKYRHNALSYIRCEKGIYWCLLQLTFITLWDRDVLVIATPYASGFDHFYIADEVQFKFDRCLRFLQERVSFSFCLRCDGLSSFVSYECPLVT